MTPFQTWRSGYELWLAMAQAPVIVAARMMRMAGVWPAAVPGAWAGAARRAAAPAAPEVAEAGPEAPGAATVKAMAEAVAPKPRGRKAKVGA